MSEPKLRVISLGAGVQSSTMALMAARGDIGPMPDCAIFADTGWEPRGVYDWLDNWLIPWLPFPVYRVSAGNLRENAVNGVNITGHNYQEIPWYGEKGMGRRQCTNKYKIEPIAKLQRKLLGYESRQRIPAGSCEVWVGISTDEAQRMKDARNKWQVNRWPLIEMGMSRRDCLRWLRDRQSPEPPKSSCLGCPFHTNAQWRDLRDNDPEGWVDACAVDAAIRETRRRRQFMHRSLKPLAEVDLLTPAERGQHEFGFLQECDGICGV
jgi:hypothetical protein